MTPSSTNRHGKRYRYYIASEAARTKDAGLVTRLPAADIEELVINHIEKQIKPDDRLTKARLNQLRCNDPIIQAEAIEHFVKKIIVHDNAVRVDLLSRPSELQTIAYRFIEAGPKRRLEVNGSDPKAKEDAELQLRNLIQGYVWREMYFDERKSIDQIAELAGISQVEVAKGINGSFSTAAVVSVLLAKTAVSS